MQRFLKCKPLLFSIAWGIMLPTLHCPLAGQSTQTTPSQIQEEPTPPTAPLNKEMTLSIIKPDAVLGNHIGEIISRFEKAGLRVVAIKSVHMTKDQASTFYNIHKDRPYFTALTEFMSSGPAIAIVLEGDNAIIKNREIMGSTDPRKAASGTIRADFAQSIRKNAVHGSDSPEHAKEEILFFFTKEELN